MTRSSNISSPECRWRPPAGQSSLHSGRVTSIEDLDRRFYPDPIDEHVLFDRMVHAYVGPDAVVLDAGAGRGSVFPYDYRDLAARIVGVDRDTAVLENPNVDEAAVADLAHLPYRDGEFDTIFSRFVFEHLERPGAVLRELRRVLKPGGHLLIHTPNRWHYVTLVAAVTPTRLHTWYRRRLGWTGGPAFATKYRANTPAALERLAHASGFAIRSLELLEPKPSYLALHPLAYRAGIAYERLVNRYQTLARFRANILADLQAVDIVPDAATARP
jgi:SAM-dependent methyltransferase